MKQAVKFLAEPLRKLFRIKVPLPVAFLSVCGTQVKLLPINQPFTTLDRVVEMVPEAVDKVTGFIQSRKKKGDAQPAEDLADEIAAEAAEQIAEKLD